MKFVIFLVAFIAGASAKNDLLEDSSKSVDEQCAPHCYYLLSSLAQSAVEAKEEFEKNAVTILNKDKQIKELETKVAELQANLELLREKESEFQAKLKSNDDLVIDVGLKLDSLKNKVAQIAEIKSNITVSSIN